MLLVLALFVAMPGRGVAHDTPLAEPDDSMVSSGITFEQIDLRDGLSQSTVYSSIQDSRGFIWIGTRDGLNRFDGYQMEVYRVGDDQSKTISNPRVRALYEDPHQYLWVATDGGGINLIDINTGEIHYRESHGDGNILAFAELGEQLLLAGTRYNGLVAYDIDSQKRVPFNASLSEAGTIWELYKLSSGWILAGTDNGIYAVSQEGFSHHLLEGYTVKSLASLNEHWLWAGTDTEGLKKFEIELHPERNEIGIEKRDAKLPGQQILAIYAENRQNLWVGSGSEGLFHINPATQAIKNYQMDQTDPRSISDNSIRSISIDRTGMIWIGTNNGGISTYSRYRQKFTHSTPIQGKPCTNIVLSFTDDALGNLWVGSQREGICLLNRETGLYHQLAHNPQNEHSLSANDVISMIRISDDRILVGTDYGGLNLATVTPESVSFISFKNQPDDEHSLSDDTVLTLLESSAGDIWVGTFRGLNLFDPKAHQFKRIDSDLHPSLPPADTRILAIHEDDRGYIWVGTHSRGIYRVDANFSAKNFTSAESSPFPLSSNYIYSITHTDSDFLWAGTDNGLNKIHLDRKEVIHYTTADGLANNTVYGVVPVDESTLWLSTNNGLSRFSVDTGEFLNFSESDGLQSREFNGGAYFKDEAGRLYFGGINGYNTFHPDSIPTNTLQPQLAITGMEVNRKPWDIASDNAIHLSHDQNFISVWFTALDFISPESNRFKYRLAGLEDDWNELRGERVARYTSLPPGDYTFELLGSNADGVWSQEPLLAYIRITPPFWATWWFRLSMITMISLLLIAAYQYRVYHLLREEKTRIQIARDLHDEISSTLSSIHFFADAIGFQHVGKKEATRFLDLISTSSRDAKEKISDIVWIIRPEQDDWKSIRLRINRFTADLLEAKDIDYKLRFGSSIPENIKLHTKKNLWLSYKEILTNIVRHSEADRVEIVISYSKKNIYLKIEDNGKGFDIGQKYDGNGIGNIRSRIEELNGKCMLHSEPGSGTVWELYIPAH